MASLVCIKRGAVIEADKSIKSQVRLMNFSEGSPYETLHSYISKTVAPYFKSYVKESGRADRLVFINDSFLFLFYVPDLELGGRIFLLINAIIKCIYKIFIGVLKLLNN